MQDHQASPQRDASLADARAQSDVLWRPSRSRQVVGLLGWIALCFAVAGIGSAATFSSVTTWYQTLAKPNWTPPDWVFGPVWTVLYLSMAVAAWLVWRGSVWRSGGWRAARVPLGLFVLQLALNLSWSLVFFGWRAPGFAFAEIVVLWVAIVATTFAFWRRSRIAGLLFVPYLAWTSFAAVLNFAIWRINV